MNDLLNGLKRLADSGGRGVLAEITETAGSTPRKAGARMLLTPDGAFAGSVGGGILEYHAEQECRHVLETGEPSRRTFSLAGSARPGEDIGAICGGSATLAFRPLDADGARALLAAMPAPPRVLLYGAGHVGKALADALALLGLPVTVTDEREGLLTAERFPHAQRQLCPLETAPMEPGPADLVVIMTHGHAHDYALLRRAMDTPAAYIGVMASRAKAAAFRQRLLADGAAQEDIDRRLHSPVGLAIGAQTPEEIAVSIAAELIAVLRKGNAHGY